MSDKFEKLTGVVYKKWKSSHRRKFYEHPDEEEFACFIEGRLSPAESLQMKEHLISCPHCAEVFAVQSRIKSTGNLAVPAELIARIKEATGKQVLTPALEIILRFKERVFELIKASGDVLVGQELVPAPVLRSRRIKDFKDEITVLKDFQDIRVEIKIENKGAGAFDLSVTVKEKQSSRPLKDLRIALTKNDLELESYHSDLGRVTFEHVLLGRYIIQIYSAESTIAHILLDIKK
ncbi:MAG: hypothetical protein PHF11_03275 [Candidatus Omnitrophica bacterium]|nr:hypothetical protein [Candidatus Omnitrophota bacterium]